MSNLQEIKEKWLNEKLKSISPAMNEAIADWWFKEIVKERMRILEILHQHFLGSKNKDVLDALQAIQAEIHSHE